MEIEDLTVFIAGCGSIGRRHAGVLKGMGVHSLILFDPRREVAYALAKELNASVADSFEDGISMGCHAVYVLSPTALHVKQAAAAIEKGKPVFIEKPLSHSMEGVEELRALQRQTGRIAAVGFCFRFHPGIRRAKAIVDSGEIGRVVSIRALMGEHFPDMRPDYLSTYCVKYSGAFELIHDLDLALWFAGKPMLRSESYWGSFASLGFESPDTAEIILDFGDSLASVHLDFFQSPRRRQFEVMGTEGTVTVEFADWNAFTVRLFTRKSGCWKEESSTTSRNTMFELQSREFLNAILHGSGVTCTLEEGKKSLEVYSSVYADKAAMDMEAKACG